MRTRILVILSFGLFIYSDTFACKCHGRQLGIEYYNEVRAIFIGKVVKVNKGLRSTTMKFEVIKHYKGSKSKFITVNSRNTSCSLNYLEEGDVWLMYAYRSWGHLETNRCALCKKADNINFIADTIFLEKVSNQSDQVIKIDGGEGKLSKGKPTGQWKYSTTSFLGGHSITIGNYRKGKKHGLWSEYKDNGELSQQEFYKHGKIKWEKSYIDSIVTTETYYTFWGLIETLEKKYYSNCKLPQTSTI